MTVRGGKHYHRYSQNIVKILLNKLRYHSHQVYIKAISLPPTAQHWAAQRQKTSLGWALTCFLPSWFVFRSLSSSSMFLSLSAISLHLPISALYWAWVLSDTSFNSDTNTYGNIQWLCHLFVTLFTIDQGFPTFVSQGTYFTLEKKIKKIYWHTNEQNDSQKKATRFNYVPSAV